LALIDNSVRLNADRPMTESEWTLELIRAGHADWSEDEKRWREASAETVLQAPPEPSSEGLSARTREKGAPKVSQSGPPDRGRTLRARAKQLTRKRRADES
jgi:hypothetical protein